MMKVRVPLFEVVIYWPWPLDRELGELGGEVPFTLEVKVSTSFQRVDHPLDEYGLNPPVYQPTDLPNIRIDTGPGD